MVPESGSGLYSPWRTDLVYCAATAAVPNDIAVSYIIKTNSNAVNAIFLENQALIKLDLPNITVVMPLVILYYSRKKVVIKCYRTCSSVPDLVLNSLP